jgi:hypothetical protein
MSVVVIEKGESDMRARMTKLIAGLAAISALAVGGAALAGAAGKQAPPVNPPAAVAGVQQGSQTAPDTGTTGEQPGESATESSSESASEPAGESSTESAAEAAGSEVAGNDGPGGHADEPGNPNADHQFEGQE